MSYVVFATVPVKQEHIDAARAAVDAVVPATVAEDGCIEFRPYRAADGSPTIMIFEEWADRAAFDFHHNQPYVKAVYEKYEDWLSGEPQIVEVKSLKD